MTTLPWVDIIGIVGLVEVLFAYAMLSMKKWESDTVSYQLMNLNGSIFLAINAWVHGAYPIVALNVVWAVIGLIVITKIYWKTKKAAS